MSSVISNQSLGEAPEQAVATPMNQTSTEEASFVGTGPTESYSSQQADSTEDTFTVPTDNGIFEFMTPVRAIELYKRLHSEGKLDLKWKFHGRKSPNVTKNNPAATQDQESSTETKESNQDDKTNTEFDFDEEFSGLDDETATGESLQLQKRPEASSEKRTNLSDIMNDIRKEISQENEVIPPDPPNESS